MANSDPNSSQPATSNSAQSVAGSVVKGIVDPTGIFSGLSDTAGVLASAWNMLSDVTFWRSLAWITLGGLLVAMGLAWLVKGPALKAAGAAAKAM